MSVKNINFPRHDLLIGGLSEIRRETSYPCLEKLLKLVAQAFQPAQGAFHAPGFTGSPRGDGAAFGFVLL